MYDLASAGAGIIDCSCNRHSFLFLLGGWGWGAVWFGCHTAPCTSLQEKNDPPSNSGLSADQSKLVTAVHH